MKTSDNLQFSNMIQSNELRLGNIVYKDYNKNEIVYIKAIHPGEMAVEPIPLTPEILSRYLKQDGSSYKINRWFGVVHINNKFWLECNGEYVMMEDVPEIKYLHHLQNLYFFLAGKELEIKELILNK